MSLWVWVLVGVSLLSGMCVYVHVCPCVVLMDHVSTPPTVVCSLCAMPTSRPLPQSRTLRLLANAYLEWDSSANWQKALNAVGEWWMGSGGCASREGEWEGREGRRWGVGVSKG